MIETPSRPAPETIAAPPRHAARRASSWARTTSPRTPGRARARARPLLPLLMPSPAARAGLAILDGVCNEFPTWTGSAPSAEQGRDLGFDGKTLIHPTRSARQHVLRPSEEEVAAPAGHRCLRPARERQARRHEGRGPHVRAPAYRHGQARGVVVGGHRLQGVLIGRRPAGPKAPGPPAKKAANASRRRLLSPPRRRAGAIAQARSRLTRRRSPRDAHHQPTRL